jgi:hypothetical protein
VTVPFKRDLRLHGKSPSAKATSRSYSIMVRDAIADRVRAMPFFSGFSIVTNNAWQIQPSVLPRCGVYFVREVGIADGDPQDGEPRFRTSVRIGFSVIVINNDPDKAEYQLDAAWQVLTGNLFSDPTLYNNSLFKIQAYSNVNRQHFFGNASKDNETPIAELRYELVCDLGAILYPPVVADDLEIIHVKTAFPIDGTGDDKANTLQVQAEYDIEQN